MVVEGFLDFWSLIDIASSLDRTIDYLSEHRLITPIDEPLFCSKLTNNVECGLPMRLGNVSGLTDGMRWRCNKYCNSTKSKTRKHFFEVKAYSSSIVSFVLALVHG
jgi:hypothetical protein